MLYMFMRPRGGNKGRKTFQCGPMLFLSVLCSSLNARCALRRVQPSIIMRPCAIKKDTKTFPYGPVAVLVNCSLQNAKEHVEHSGTFPGRPAIVASRAAYHCYEALC